MQIMDLWLVVPLCYGCALDRSCDGVVRPFIHPIHWQAGIRESIGETVLRMTRRQLRGDPTFAYQCHSCHTSLRPWDGDQMSASHLHLEEYFDFPLDAPGRRKPSASVRKLIQQLYGNKCFGCGARKTRENDLHIDHIIPQSKGGTSAFRNLQPLCEQCGNSKSDRQPNQVEVCSTIFFGPYPSDSYEGLFW